MRQPWHPVHDPGSPCPQCGQPIMVIDQQVGHVLILGSRCPCGWAETVLIERPSVLTA